MKLLSEFLRKSFQFFLSEFSGSCMACAVRGTTQFHGVGHWRNVISILFLLLFSWSSWSDSCWLLTIFGGNAHRQRHPTQFQHLFVPNLCILLFSRMWRTSSSTAAAATAYARQWTHTHTNDGYTTRAQANILMKQEAAASTMYDVKVKTANNSNNNEKRDKRNQLIRLVTVVVHNISVSHHKWVYVRVCVCLGRS